MDNKIQSLNTIREVEEYRNQVNEECNSRVKLINLVRKADDLSNKSFGYIKECFEALSPELFNSKEGKKILNKYTETIKENKNLSMLHKLHETVRKASTNVDSDFFVNSLSNTNWEINKKTVNEDVKKLGKVLAEAYITLGDDKSDDLLPKENEKLYSAINYLGENTLTKNNIVEHSDAIKIIKESIANKENSTSIFESKKLDDLAEELLKEFNKKYSETLNEEEAKVLKEIASSENREEVFNRYKALCAESISNAKAVFEEKGDTNSSKRLSSVLEQVNGKKFSLDTVGEDICNLIELSNIFE